MRPTPEKNEVQRPKSPWGIANASLAVTAIVGHGISWAYPGLWLGVWIGQAALIWLAVRHSPRVAFLLGLFVGAIAEAWAFHWAPQALEISMDAPWWLSHLLFALLMLWEGLAFAVFCAFVAFFTRRDARGIWLAPVAWVATQSWWPKIFPWMIAYSQWELTPLLQIAEITGSCGIDFVVTSLTSIPAAVWLSYRDRSFSNMRSWITTYAVGNALLLAGVLAFGWYQLQAWSAPPQRSLRVALVQTNVGLMGSEEKLLSMSRQLPAAVELVCWPESALGTYHRDLPHFRDEEQTLLQSRYAYNHLRPVRDLPFDLLAGGRSYTSQAADDGPYSMTAFLIEPSETIRARYLKRTLLPFGEYMPGQDWFPALREWATLRDTIEPGKSAAPLITSSGAKLGVIICYEDLVRADVRESVRAGGEILISLINDGAFENPLTLEQHKRLALLRSVENRRWLLRCSSTGATCSVAPTGEITDALPIKEDGMIVRECGLYNYQTIYTRYGEWFAWLCTLGCAVGWFVYRRPRGELLR